MVPAVVAAASLTVLAGAWLTMSWWTWRPLVRHRVVVQLEDGSSFEGVAMSRRGPLLVLDDVTVRVGGGSQRIDGRVVVERTRVVFVQVI